MIELGKTDAAIAAHQGWLHIRGQGVWAPVAAWETAETYGAEPDADYLDEGWMPYAVTGDEGSRVFHYRRPVWLEVDDG